MVWDRPARSLLWRGPEPGERNLNNTTAQYSLKPDGSIKVVNRGYNTKTGEWEQAEAKAKFVGDQDIAMLKVSFFGPFYSGYNVIAIDPEYNYALVAGASLKYLWILAREPRMPEEVKNNYLKIAEDGGYDTSELLWVEHNDQEWRAELFSQGLAHLIRIIHGICFM